MILTITIVLTVLVAFNFFLLLFSCNKTNKRVTEDKKPILVKNQLTKQSAPLHLSPTGS